MDGKSRGTKKNVFISKVKTELSTCLAQIQEHLIEAQGQKNGTGKYETKIERQHRTSGEMG